MTIIERGLAGGGRLMVLDEPAAGARCVCGNPDTDRLIGLRAVVADIPVLMHACPECLLAGVSLSARVFHGRAPEVAG